MINPTQYGASIQLGHNFLIPPFYTPSFYNYGSIFIGLFHNTLRKGIFNHFYTYQSKNYYMALHPTKALMIVQNHEYKRLGLYLNQAATKDEIAKYNIEEKNIDFNESEPFTVTWNRENS